MFNIHLWLISNKTRKQLTSVNPPKSFLQCFYAFRQDAFSECQRVPDTVPKTPAELAVCIASVHVGHFLQVMAQTLFIAKVFTFQSSG